MSPVIFPVAAREPTQFFGFETWGGMTSATGSPKRVTRTGLPVVLTLSKTARQVALNFEMAISSIVKPYNHSTMVNDYGQLGKLDSTEIHHKPTVTDRTSA